MGRPDVEKFLQDYATDKDGLKGKYAANRMDAVKKYKGAKLTTDEQHLLARGNAHEIKQYLTDSYRAALSVNIP